MATPGRAADIGRRPLFQATGAVPMTVRGPAPACEAAQVADPSVSPGSTTIVSDVTAPALDGFRGLKEQRWRRHFEREHGIVTVEGLVAVEQLLVSGHETRTVLVEDRKVATLAALLDRARDAGAAVFVADRSQIAQIVGFDLHRGVVAIARRPPALDPIELLARASGDRSLGDRPSRASLVAVLEGLNDAENLGSVLRCAAAFGLAGVFLDPRCADPLTRRSIRVSSGHALRIPFARIPHWPDDLDQLRAAGLFVVALVPHPERHQPEGSRVLTVAELCGSWGADHRRDGAGRARGIALLLGSEGPGLSPGAIARADQLVTIPTAAEVDSLNVAVAGAIAFHQLSSSAEPCRGA